MGLVRKFGWSYLMTLCLALVTIAADDTSSTSIPTPPEFNAMISNGMANMFQRCFDLNPLLNQTGNMATALITGKDIKGGMNPDGSCAGSDTLPSTASYDSCDYYSADFLKMENDKLDSVAGAISCKKTKLDQLKAELGCLTTQADSLAAQISSLQAAFVKNIQRMQQDVQTLKSREEDIKAQQMDVNTKLMGTDPEKGGLFKARERLEKAATGLPQTITMIQNEQTDVANMKKRLEENVKVRAMAMATSCFRNQKVSGYTCNEDNEEEGIKKGESVTLEQYLICRYRQNQYIGPSGKLEVSKTRASMANAKKREFKNLIDTIFNEMPSDPNVSVVSKGDPATAKASQGSSGPQPMNILAIADLVKKYGSQLDGYNSKGLAIKNFFVDKMSQCYKSANAKISKERGASSGVIWESQENIKKEERAINSKVNSLLNQLNQEYSDAMSALTGNHYPLNVGACQSAKPDIQLGCLREIRTNLEGLLAGNTPQSIMKMSIKGNNPQTYVTFNCQGINGCIASLQNLQKNLVTEGQKVTLAKQNYITKSNQQIESFIKGGGPNNSQGLLGILNEQSKALANRLKSINLAMANLGVDSAIEIKQVDAENFETDADGLYKVPKSIMKLVGGMMSPPMLDVHGNDFSGGLRGVSEAVKDMKSSEREVEDARKKLTLLTKKCPKEKLEKKMQSLAEKVKDFNSECVEPASHVSDCQAYAATRVDELMSDVRALFLEKPDNIDVDLPSQYLSGYLCPENISNVPKDSVTRPGPRFGVAGCLRAYNGIKESYDSAKKTQEKILGSSSDAGTTRK